MKLDRGLPVWQKAKDIFSQIISPLSKYIMKNQIVWHMWDASLLWLYSKTVGQWTLTFSLHNHVTEIKNMLHIANYSEFKLYLPDGYFETIASKIGAFLPVWPL